nr:IS110 family transposase [Bacillus sp. M6-12]
MGKKICDLLTEDLQTVQDQMHNWIDRYFPEFLTVFKKWEGKAALQFLRLYALPHEIVNFKEHALLSQLRKSVTQSVGISKIRELKKAASKSIGLRQGSNMAKLDAKIDTLLDEIPGVPQMLAIKGVGRDKVAGFFAEVGDLKEYTHPRQIIKLAGLSLKENTSGKHKGKTTITKRGRKKLRALMFRVFMTLVAKNSAFKALHELYETLR